MTPDQTAEILAEIAEVLGLEMPADQRDVRFFSARIIGIVRANAKQSVMYQRIAGNLKDIVNG